MRFEASIKNTISSVILQIVTMIIGFILPRLYLTQFGSEINGLVSSITQFISYFTLVEAGLASVITASLYIPLAQKNNTKVNQILTAAKNYYIKIGYIFSGLVISLAIIYPFIISTQSLSSFEIVVLVIVLGFHGAFDFFTLARYRALLTADQKYYVVANATTISNILNFLLVYICIKLSFGIIEVRALALTTYIIRSIILNIYIRYHYKYVDYSVIPDSNALNKRWDAMILQLLGLVQTSMPVVMLTIFTKDLKIISVYSIYNLVASNIIAILTAVTNGFAASFGDIIAKKETDILKKTYRQYEVLFYSLMTLAYSCMNILYISFVKIYTSGVTDINYIQPSIALLFVINGIMYNLKTPAGTLIGAAGVFKETKKSTIIQTAIAIILTLVLTPIWDIKGVLIALIVSNLYRDIDLIIYMSNNVTKIPYIETFKRIFGYLIIIVISNIPFHYISLNPSNLLKWFLDALIVSIWCTLLIILYNVIFEKDILLDIFKRIKIKFKGVN